MTMLVSGLDDNDVQREIRTDPDGRLQLSPTAGAGAPGTHVGSSALEKSHVVSDATCTLRSAKALNSGVADLYLFVLDADALPGDGAVPSRIPIPIPAGAVNGDVWQGGTTMAAGCVLALSSTLSTLTLVATSVGWFDAEIDS